jgi:phenylacetic acid degradation operon negative regulatory protein
VKKFTKNEAGEIILSTLLTVGFLTFAIAMPNAVQIFKYFDPKNTKDKWKIKRSLTRLEDGNLIKKRLIAGEEQYILTETGKKRAMRYHLFSMKIAEQSKWDGLWRIVMFDIPENKRSARLAINLALKKLGCIQYQKSVFITPYPCAKEIDFVGECFDARRHLRLITAKEIESEIKLKKHFSL